MNVSGAAALQLGTFGAVILLVIFVIVLVAIFIYFVVWALRKKPVTGAEALVGMLGIALTDLKIGGEGEVSIDGVIWRARIGDDSSIISKNDTVIVMGISALTLLVRKEKSQLKVP